MWHDLINAEYLGFTIFILSVKQGIICALSLFLIWAFGMWHCRYSREIKTIVGVYFIVAVIIELVIWFS